ncbi:MAG: putative zinc-binding protein [Planctomycetota bacterium]|nr:putative zinc-binding protein [Planctomycetota bacterium]
MPEATLTETAVRLVFACSGAADVGEIADRVARLLQREGTARMYCLGGIGSKVDDILSTARGAERIMVIDGCPLDCAKRCLEQAGFTGIRHLRLTDHQMEKGKTPVTVRNVQLAADRAKHVLLAP